MQICRKENLKLNKDKLHFRHMRAPYFSEVVSICAQPDPHKLHMQTEMPCTKNKKELHFFLGIMRYLGKFSSSTTKSM